MMAKKATDAETHAGGRKSAVSDAAAGGARTRRTTAARDAAEADVPGTKAAAGKSAGPKAASKRTGAARRSTTAARRTGRAGAAAAGDAERGTAKKAAGKGPARDEAAARTADDGAGARQGAREGNGAARTSGSAQDGAGHSAADDADAAEAAAQTGVTTVGAKKTPGPAATAAAATAVPKARYGAVEPGELAVRPGEEPWTGEEVEAARAELMSEVLRLREEITSSERSLAGLMRDSGDGAGDDDADTGTKNITREHELALAANAREMLDQFERALQRLDAGTYGLCENCGEPIGKARMQAFPRATLCVECKQKQERRY
ncbi:TraR/DksA family transcriptional regulator [Streptomyces albogriseolus]|uniref:TraR/DksA family transcriptional regulator n=1 Tax=Streptomyces TaxID=1883 RepID=UPI001E47C507|nr:TraR/DksA C4-type zinc finger protein [Streptomyces sp. DH20]